MKNKLRKINIYLKVFLLVIIGVSLFPYLKSETYISPYLAYLVFVNLFAEWLYYKLSSKQSLLFVFKLWLIGLALYSIFALVFWLNNWSISPTLQINESKNVLLYLLSYPIRILAVFYIGLSFIELVSPVEFLQFGKIGIYICFLLRSFQVAKEQMLNNKKAMEIMGEIPESLKSISDYRLFLHKSPLIIALTIRNLMIWLFWASHQFEKLKKEN